MTKRERKQAVVKLCARCGNETRGAYCGDCQRLGFGPYLQVTAEADEALIWAIEHHGTPQAQLARMAGVSRVAIGRRYRRALLRQQRRAELGW